VARAIIGADVHPKRGPIRVLFCTSNCPEWFYAHTGAILAGAICVAVPKILSPEGISRVIQETHATLAFVDDDASPRVVTANSERGAVTIVRLMTRLSPAVVPGTVAFADFAKMASAASEADVAAAVRGLQPSAPCEVVYAPSSSDADYRGVILSHSNLTSAAAAVVSFVRVWKPDNLICFMPLWSVEEQVMSYHVPMAVGCRVSIAAPDCLRVRRLRLPRSPA
jgi:long-subunit acyl-CoA synthetase (AMP-forming)